MNHSLPYSFVGIQTLILATNFPVLYWDCACLIVNSGGIDELEDEDIEMEDDEEDVIEEDEKKKKSKATDYGRIAIALGQMQSSNITVTPPDINHSSYTFSPNTATNTILYGLRGINKIGNDLVNSILTFRPYTSIENFLSKVKVNKPQMINLIKAGAFDGFDKQRIETMHHYIDLISDVKQKLNLQNMQMLINFNLIPSDYAFDLQVYHFNKYLKKSKLGDYYGLDAIAQKFYEQHFSLDNLYYQNESEYIALILQKTWDKIYTKQMNGIRDYIKKNQTELLATVNHKLTSDTWEKYCKGTLSKWEMDAVSFYSHEHELAHINERAYSLINFFHLPEDPQVETVISINGRDIPLMKLSRIAGTVLDKDKNKSTVTLLTKYGVVPVKIYRAQFVKYDKQISERQEDGHKKVIEKSWFSRGNKLIFTGIRRGDTFVPKVYKRSEFRDPILLITQLLDDGYLLTTSQRVNTDVSDDL